MTGVATSTPKHPCVDCAHRVKGRCKFGLDSHLDNWYRRPGEADTTCLCRADTPAQPDSAEAAR